MDEFAKDIERELKDLEDQKIPQISSFQSLPCEILFQQKQNDTWLPFPFDIGDQQTNFDKYFFCDPVVDYMESFFSLNVQLYFHYGDKMHHELPLLLYCLVFILFKHGQGVKLLNWLLDWLHWIYHVT